MSESTMTVYEWGTKAWRNSAGQCHRTEGPAVEWANGRKEWWVNGKRHRTDGPAIERANGEKEWWVKGRCHRTNGPAVEWSNGVKEWWVNGKFLDSNEEGFWKLWEQLTPEQKKDPVLLAYLPEKF